MPGLRIHKVADKSVGRRVVMVDEEGERKLVNPDTPGEEHEPWPLVGVRLLPGPEACGISTTVVEQGITEGWLTAEAARTVARPGGPPGDAWRPDKVHLFRHADALVFHTLDGDVRFLVTHQPDKYADHGEATFPDQVAEFDADDETPVTDEMYAAGATRVDWFYGIQREG